MGGQPDRRCRHEQSLPDGLLDPVGGVGAEAAADGRIEISDRPDEPEVALAHEVVERQAPAGVVAGDATTSLRLARIIRDLAASSPRAIAAANSRSSVADRRGSEYSPPE